MKFVSCWCVVFVIIFSECIAVRHFTPCPPVKLKYGRIKYRQRGRFIKFTCNPGYQMAGEKYSTCIQGKWDNPIPKCVRPTCSKVKAPANGLIYPSHGGGVLNFYCMPGYEVRGPYIVYCDGQKWDDNSPTCIANGTKPALSCDFENEHLCGWTHDFNHDFDWRRLNFKTPSGTIGTGPSYDHTKGDNSDGYYMYTESSSRNINDTARLISPIYDKASSNTCFQFYYHMFGATMGELRVYLKKASQSWYENPSSAFFLKKGNQGDKWYKSITELGVIPEDFQIVIEGIRGTGYVSDIAIDDVELIPNCTIEQEQSTTEDYEYYKIVTPKIIESCENRCHNNSFAGNLSLPENHYIACDCDWDCYFRSRCCPDYLDLCVGGSTVNDYDGENEDEAFYTTKLQLQTTKDIVKITENEVPIIEEEIFSTMGKLDLHTSTEISNEVPGLPEKLRPIPESVTVRKPIFPTTMRSLPTRVPTREVVQTKVPIHTKIVFPNEVIVTSKTLPPKSFTELKQPSVTSKSHQNIKYNAHSTYFEISTTKLIPNSPHPETPHPSVVQSKDQDSVVQSKDQDSVVQNEDQDVSDVLVIPTNEDDELLITKMTSVEEKVKTKMNEEVENEIDRRFFRYGKNEKIVIQTKGENELSSSLNILAGVSVMIVIVVIAGGVYLVKSRSCDKLRRMKKSNSGNSQSDVRFLTSDEILDFSVADNQNEIYYL